MGLDLLPFIEGSERLLIVDAVNSGSAPASLRIFEGAEIPSALSQKFSVHQIGVQDMLFAMDITDTAPEEICLVGIEPKAVELGLELSPELGGAMPGLLEAVVGRLKKWDVEVRRKEDVPRNSIQDSR